MRKRTLGTTGLEVSLLGLGTVKFGRTQGLKYPQAFDLPSDDDIKRLIASAQSLGLNLIDTAPAYGSAEERLGQALKGQRHDWVLVSKLGEEFSEGQSHFDFSAKHSLMSLERSLKRLQTDYLDCVLVHSNGEDLKIIEHSPVLEVLAEAKARGLIRSFGMSTKTVEGGIKALSLADVAMVMYNPLEVAEQPVIDYAQAHQKGILVKKALMSGHLYKFETADPIGHALNFCVAHPGVSSIILGTDNIAHLRQAVEAVADFSQDKIE